MRRNKFALAAVLTAALMLVGCGAGEGQSAPSGTDSSSDAAILAEFTAEDLDGNTVDQSVLTGKKLTMMNVWATFCSPCLREMPELGQLSAEYAEKDVQIIGVVNDTLNRDGTLNADQVALAKELVAKTGADAYLHLLPSESLYNANISNVRAVPTTFFVDETGRLVGEAVVGAHSADDWRTIIDERLEALEQ